MEYTIEVCGHCLPRVAWTGGESPPKRCRDSLYRATRSAYFREQVADSGGLDLWACAGTSPLERARIFWNRASGDAWATVSRYRS